jgi:hypothetical protein
VKASRVKTTGRARIELLNVVVLNRELESILELWE